MQFKRESEMHQVNQIQEQIVARAESNPESHVVDKWGKTGEWIERKSERSNKNLWIGESNNESSMKWVNKNQIGIKFNLAIESMSQIRRWIHCTVIDSIKMNRVNLQRLDCRESPLNQIREWIKYPRDPISISIIHENFFFKSLKISSLVRHNTMNKNLKFATNESNMNTNVSKNWIKHRSDRGRWRVNQWIEYTGPSQ